jgi:hypothetical protein
LPSGASQPPFAEAQQSSLRSQALIEGRGDEGEGGGFVRFLELSRKSAPPPPPHLPHLLHLPLPLSLLLECRTSMQRETL